MLGLGQNSNAAERLAAEQEADAADVLGRLSKDRSAVTAALMELPGIADAKTALQQSQQLLGRVNGMQLTKRDLSWMRALQLCIEERDALDSQELARLMAGKRQWDFLARRFNKLQVHAVMEELEIDGLEELFVAIKLFEAGACPAARCVVREEEEAEDLPVKRRRLSTSPRSSTASPDQLQILPGSTAVQPATLTDLTSTEHVSQVGEVLASKLEAAKQSDRAAALKLRDVLVELYQLIQDANYMAKLAALVRQDHQHLHLEGWAQRVELPVLQALLRECASHAESTALDEVLNNRAFIDKAVVASELFLVLASMLAVLGERLEAQGELQGAADAFRRALEMHPQHPSARSSLLDVILAQFSLCSDDVSASELLELLATEGRWEQLVELYDSLEAVVSDALPFWNENRLQSLAEALLAAGLTMQGGAVQVCLANWYEQAGLVELAYRHYRKAFEMNPGDAKAEAGMCRLALSAGCVQDAATELLLKQASGSQPELAASRIREAVQLLSAHAASLAQDAKRDAEASFAKRLAELENTKLQKAEQERTTQDASSKLKTPTGSFLNFPCFGRQQTPQVSSSPSPPVSKALASLPPPPQHPPPAPQAQVEPSTAVGQGHRLRVKYPGRVPVVCRPAAEAGNSQSQEILGKMQFLVPEQMSCGELKKLMHRKVALSAAGKGAAIGAAGIVSHSTPVDSALSFGKLYDMHAADDACLHFTYSIERSLGGGLGLELFPASSLSSGVEADGEVSSWDKETRTGFVRSRA